jgi:hypothetical protein
LTASRKQSNQTESEAADSEPKLTITNVEDEEGTVNLMASGEKTKTKLVIINQFDY